ncbi:methionine aminopeptidase, partial [Bifidobacterium longum]
LFGAKKLPELAKSIGQSMKIFRAETKTDDPATQQTVNTVSDAPAPAPAAAPAPAPAVPQAVTMNATAAQTESTDQADVLDDILDDSYTGNGVSELSNLSMSALLDTGDEVLVPSPDSPLWTACVNLAGGTAVHYLCDEQSEWYPDIDDIRSKITSNTIGDVAREYGYPINLEFGGHGVGHIMHGDPHVPNDGRAHHGYKLREGLVIAIEPWFLKTTDEIFQDPKDGWTLRASDGSRGAHSEHTIAITENGPIVFTDRTNL